MNLQVILAYSFVFFDMFFNNLLKVNVALKLTYIYPNIMSKKGVVNVKFPVYSGKFRYRMSLSRCYFLSSITKHISIQ